MRILFVLEKESLEECLIDFSKRCIQHLTVNHRPGIFTNALLDDPINQYIQRDIHFEEWNIAIVQDVISLQWFIQCDENKSIPVIFISHNESWKFQPFLTGNILKVFSLHFGKSISLPRELVQNIDKPIFITGSNTNEDRDLNISDNGGKIRCIHFCQPEDHDLAIVKMIIHFFNANLNIQLTIISKKTIHAILKPLINNNITLQEDMSNGGEISSEFHFAITSEYYALNMLYRGIPTVIVGKRGFGGLVTSETIADHLKWNFTGRIGGEIGETVPFWILYDEVAFLKKNMPAVFEDTRKLAVDIRNRFNPERIFSFLENEITEAYEHYVSIFSEKSHSLKPVLVRGIQIEESVKENSYFIMKENNKIAGLISELENRVFKQLDGKKTVLHIAGETGLNTDDVYSFIKDLWYQKIISFAK